MLYAARGDTYDEQTCAASAKLSAPRTSANERRTGISVLSSLDSKQMAEKALFQVLYLWMGTGKLCHLSCFEEQILLRCCKHLQCL